MKRGAETPKTGGDFHERLYPKPHYQKTEQQENAALKSSKLNLEYEKVVYNKILGENKDLYNRIVQMRTEIKYA